MYFGMLAWDHVLESKAYKIETEGQDLPGIPGNAIFNLEYTIEIIWVNVKELDDLVEEAIKLILSSLNDHRDAHRCFVNCVVLPIFNLRTKTDSSDSR